MIGYDWPRLHAALNDLPAALLLAAVLFDLAGAITKRPALRTAGFLTLLLGAAGGAAAVLSGLQAEQHVAHGEAVHRVMETHEKLGFITLGIFGVLALWRSVREKRMGSTERAVSLALSLGGTAALFATAIYGGRMVFEHAAGIPTEVLQAEMRERSAEHRHQGGGAGNGTSGHDQPAPGATADTAPATPALDSAQPAGHSHAPGTPPHQD